MSIFFILEKKFITLTAIKRGHGAVFHKFALDLTLLSISQNTVLFIICYRFNLLIQDMITLIKV